MQKILITGGAGFIGSHCVDLLLSKGCEVTVLDIKKAAEAINLQHCMENITYREGDIREIDDLKEAVIGCDAILHLAAIVSVPVSIAEPLETHETNVTGTMNVFESAKEVGIQRVVYASSAAVYGDVDVVPTPEDVPLAPLSPYGLHKMVNEEYAALYNRVTDINAVGLRFFNVYGLRQDPQSPYSGVISIFMDKMKRAEQLTIFGDGSNTRDYVHVSDVAMVCVAMLFDSDQATGIYNVGTGKRTSLQALAQAVGEVHDELVEPVYAEARNGDVLHSGGETKRLESFLGTSLQTALIDGLRTMV